MTFTFFLAVFLRSVLSPLYLGQSFFPRLSGGYFPKRFDVLSSHNSVQFSSVIQSCPTLCDPMNRSTPASLSITNSQSPPKLTSIESVMPSNHLILCRPLVHLPSILPSIRVFSYESTLCIRWPKYWSFSFNISLPMNTQD